MGLPTIYFRNVGDTVNLPQTGTSYFDLNAIDHAGGTSDTPNPLSPNSTGNSQYLRLKNTKADTTSTATNMKMYLTGADASTLSSLGYVHLVQGGTSVTLTSTDYATGNTITVASGTVGNVLSSNNGISNTITIYPKTTATGVNVSDFKFAVGYYYVP